MNRRYVLVCSGPTCRSQDSVRVRALLAEQLEAGTSRGVVVLPYPCFGLCGRGPNVVVYPDGLWLDGIEESDVPDVVRQVNGEIEAVHLYAEVSADHAEQSYAIFDEVIPELEKEHAAEQPSYRRSWLPFRRR